MLAIEKTANTGNSSEGTEAGTHSRTDLPILSSDNSTYPEAVQDVHWDRIPVDGNPRRLQFRCLIGDTIHCTSWQNPHCFKKHFETLHQMVPAGARRGRPRSRAESGSQTNRIQRITDRPPRTDSGKQMNKMQNITDRSSGHFPSKWWKRQKYQLETILRKVTKQLHQKGVKDPEVIREKATEYYSEWSNSDASQSTKQKLAESTIKYWVDKGHSAEEAAKKGGVPADIHESPSREAKPVILNETGVLRIGRKVRSASDEESRMHGGLITASGIEDEEKAEEYRSTSEEEEEKQEEERKFLFLGNSASANEEQGVADKNNHEDQGRTFFTQRSVPTACAVSRQDELTRDLDLQHTSGSRIGEGVTSCPECIF
ncbi:hypothetical protein R1flu_024420 [Riccia fluitans]|uniref:Uncharacterized protein n=1 Tax=Riccia fluitans TaxID=41844 RepID=A0ABD1XUU0_9MARC